MCVAGQSTRLRVESGATAAARPRDPRKHQGSQTPLTLVLFLSAFSSAISSSLSRSCSLHTLSSLVSAANSWKTEKGTLSTDPGEPSRAHQGDLAQGQRPLRFSSGMGSAHDPGPHRLPPLRHSESETPPKPANSSLYLSFPPKGHRRDQGSLNNQSDIQNTKSG